MAINTETRRRSVLGAFMVALTVLPVPDSTVGTPDRPHVAGVYAGITITSLQILDLCGPLFSGLVDPARLSALVNPLRESDLVDPARLSGLECS